MTQQSINFSTGKEHMSVLPTSVIDIGKQVSPLRDFGGHATKSSRQQYSPFPEEVSRLCYELYLRDCCAVFDPFAGWGERHFYAEEYGKQYVGFDTSDEALAFARVHFSVTNLLRDSLVDTLPTFDGLFTCPPYWNLEKYAGEGIDRVKTWDSFLTKYRMILARAYDCAIEGATFCLMVGDWRSKGKYYDLAHQTRSIFSDLGATTVDDVILSQKGISKIKIMLPQAKRLGYSVKVHQYLLVFRKETT